MLLAAGCVHRPTVVSLSNRAAENAAPNKNKQEKLSPATAAFSLAVAEDVHDLGPLLEPIITRAKIPGMVAVVLRDNRIIAEGAVGVRKKGNLARVTLDDQFEISSCTKAMTASLAALLIEDGRLEWNTTLGEIFGSSFPNMHPAWRNVTLRQMLAHRAGLDDHRLLFARKTLLSDASVSQQRFDYAETVLSHAPSYAPGSKFVYNSTDYLLVGSALEIITGRTWEDLMREKLFEPLGISSGGFGAPGHGGQIDQPWGHGKHRVLFVPLFGAGDTPFDPGSSAADYPLAGAPAGLVHLSVPDWARFVAWQLRGDPANPHPTLSLLRADTFATLHEAATGGDHAAGWVTATKPWAKGNRPDDTGRVLYHAGDNGRWSCVVWVVPEIDFAILIACNRAGMYRACDEVAWALIQQFARK